jgi:hypothetical protein
MDLHSSRSPPPESTKLSQERQLPSQVRIDPEDCTVLDLSPNVKSHLTSLFFEHIQPIYPVVSHESLSRYPATPLLEAVILGVAARDPRAIASKRDFAHIYAVVAHELKNLLSTRKRTSPSIQTVQALLLALLRLELLCQGHRDIISMGLRLSLVCKMAQDLRLSRTADAATFPGDIDHLESVIWKTCLYQDAMISAILGQPLNIVYPLDAHVPQNISIDDAREDFFNDMVDASHCLRSILRAVYADQETALGPIEKCSQVVKRLRHQETRLLQAKHFYADAKYRALQMFHHNNRLLFVLGLVSLLPQTEHKDLLSPVLAQEAPFVIMEACETLSWFNPDFYLEMASRIHPLLYCASRALMIIVDVLLEVRRTAIHPKCWVENLQHVVATATTLKDHLLQDSSWGGHWSQGHTLAAVLARLEETEQRDGLPSQLKEIIGLQTPNSIDDLHTPGEIWNPQNSSYDEDFVNSVLFNSTDWNSVLLQYDEAYPETVWQTWL